MAESDNNLNNSSKDDDKRKYIAIALAAVAVLAIGIIIGIVIGNSGKKDKDKTQVGTVADNSNNSDAGNKGNVENSAVTNTQSGNSNSNVNNDNSESTNIDNIDKSSVEDNNSSADDKDSSSNNSSSNNNDSSSDNNSSDSSDKSDKGNTNNADKTDNSNNTDGSDKSDNTGEDIIDNTDKSDNNDEIIDNDNTDNTGNIDDDDNASDVGNDTGNAGNTDDGSKENKSDDKGGSDSKGGYVLTYTVDNSWADGSTNMFGVQIGITNNTDSAVNGWKLVLDVEGLASVSGWNGTFSPNKNILTVTDAGYNGDIYAGGTIVIGCNLGTSASKVNIKAAKLNGKAMTIVSGKVDQNDPGLKNDNNGGNNNGGNGNGNNGGSGNGGSDKQGQDLIDEIKSNTTGKKGDDWLHTDGKNILDKDGKKVWLTGLNWFGYNTGTNTFDGLWNSQLKPTVKAIADHGFNLIRVPISAELINQWSKGEYPRANYNNAYNTELNSMNSLEIFDYFLALAEENGIKVMPDIHSAETNASGHNVNLWYTDKVKVNDYYHALEWMAERYKDNDTIIAFDLKNEPHGKPFEGDGAAIWNDSKKANNWKYVAETAAAKVLAKNPNVLIMVEGIEIYPVDIKKNSDYSSKNDKDYYFNWWGGNLRGVADYPVNLGKYQDKLVYSPHDYGPTVYEQPWFEGKYTYDSLMKDCWHDNWFYIYEKNIAPLLIGEWGGFMREPNLTWMTYMRKLIKTYHLNHTFWCLNANSGDTGGLLLDDFTTWDTEKYNFVKEVLWQQNGKFVGLDHEVPLGKNGITLKEAKGSL
ncbi:MAG: cellulase family glycosylhydrolase [Lachnospiraceae bacterium]|nr:cellulase family glycosylhydrolase [Lachnospiraceae bacterium]